MEEKSYKITWVTINKIVVKAKNDEDAWTFAQALDPYETFIKDDMIKIEELKPSEYEITNKKQEIKAESIIKENERN